MLHTPTTVQLGLLSMNAIKESVLTFHCERRVTQQIGLTIMGRKLGRDLNHEIIAQWEFAPFFAKISGGRKEILTVHQDYVHLYCQGGAPLFMHWWPTLLRKDDFYVLLRDIQFVETGKEPIKAIYDAAQFTLILGMASFFSNWISAFIAQFNIMSKHVKIHGTVSSTDQLVIVLVGFALWFLLHNIGGRLRRHFLHIGVLPGGTERGKRNPYGGECHVEPRRNSAPKTKRQGLFCCG